MEEEDFRELTLDEKEIVRDIFEAMEKTGSDFTETFRFLSKVPLSLPVQKETTA